MTTDISSALESRLAPADEAIRLARAGKLPIKDMIQRLLNGPLIVLTAEPMNVSVAAGSHWKPATLTKAADRSQWLVTFTDPKLAAAFAQQNPDYSHGLCVEASWVLQAIPPNHGLVVNFGSPESAFEWNAAGLEAFKQANARASVS